ncbi:uncharacterized protein RAG0_01064 [Rhynchosporium agropyri]|uniref:F-box domain-containing protein n=1 Tax=Rhynchosporium agropyri TaxID=914238 RepID=A0A1E1JVX1_9HELO|nr:uncharacterized protein RAG0_01064 [Rhynchosporium agropyri]
MSLLQLPYELLLEVLSYLVEDSDVKCLVLVSRYLYELFNDILYTRDIRSGINRAFFWSVYHGHAENLRRLIRLGVDINLREAPWTWEMVTELLPGVPDTLHRMDYEIELLPSVPSVPRPLSHRHSYKLCTSAQRIAAHNGFITGLSLLLEAGAKIEGSNLHGDPSPLALAILQDHAEVFHLLLNAMTEELRSEKQAPSQMTYLELASHHHRPEMVRAMISKGADVAIKDSRGRTPLMHAILSGGYLHWPTHVDRDLNLISPGPPLAPAMFETMKVLLDAGADPSCEVLPYPQNFRSEDFELDEIKLGLE